MNSLARDLSYAARIMRRSPGFTLTAVLALALGIGANTALFSVVNAVLLEPLPFPGPERLVQIWRTELPQMQYGAASYPRYVDWRDRNQAFEKLGAYAYRSLSLSGTEAAELVSGAEATASLFEVLGARPVLGRWFNAAEDQPGGPKVVVLGYQLWRRRFGGNPNILGTDLVLDGESRTVIGIAPPSFKELLRADAWVPLARAVDQSQRGRGFLTVFGRLRERTTLAAARARLEELAAEMRREHEGDRYGFNARMLHEVMTSGPSRALWVLLGVTGLVLLIACVNVTNMLLSRAVMRQRELEVRLALGAGRPRLFRQLVTETVLLGALGSALGLLLAAGVLRLFVIIAPANFPRLASVGIDLRVLGFSVLVALTVGVLAGIVPAVHLLRSEVSDTLRGGGGRGATAAGAKAISSTLVVAQIGLAVALVAAAGLTVKSLHQIRQQDLGLAREGVLTFQVALARGNPADGEPVASFFEGFDERLRALPGVNAVGAINMLPIAISGMNGPVSLPDRVMRPEEKPLAEFRTITPGYLESVSMRVLAGRNVELRDRLNTPRVVLVNETLARQLWPGQQESAVVGRQLGLSWDGAGNWREVIGLVRDIRSRRLEAPPTAEVYVPHAQFPVRTMSFTMRVAGAPAALVPSVRLALAELDPQLPLAAVRSFAEVVESATRDSRLLSTLTTLFGILAASLAILGIYGVMAYTVAQRTRELAIRSALGASRGGLLSLVMREGLVMSAAGISLGLAGAWAASGVLRSLLYQVSPTDPAVYTATAVGIVGLGVAGYIVPALRAARVDPAHALRSE